MTDHTKMRILGLVVAMLTMLATSCAATEPVAQADPNRQREGPSGTPIETNSESEAVFDPLGATILPAEDPPMRLLISEWSTDFSKRTVEWDEVMSGGPPKDGIPAIDEPAVESVDEAAAWLTDRDPVIFFENNGAVRAYPLAILIWHEIVNDEVGGRPVAVTFCPLCNASIVFDRNFDGRVLDFGTTGLLRNSDLVMYDRQTETWWQQFVGRGIAGEYAGEQLGFLSSQVISFADYREAFPEGEVLARPAAARSYGRNPYTNYDSTSDRPRLYSGELDDRLPSTERVVGVELGDDVMAYPFSALERLDVVNDVVGGVPIVVFHKSGTASALDSSKIREGRDVGSAVVFARMLGKDILTFEADEAGTFRDVGTGTKWNIFGEAIDGELAGRRLKRVLSFDHFWFAWSAFFADTGLWADTEGGNGGTVGAGQQIP